MVCRFHYRRKSKMISGNILRVFQRSQTRNMITRVLKVFHDEFFIFWSDGKRRDIGMIFFVEQQILILFISGWTALSKNSITAIHICHVAFVNLDKIIGELWEQRFQGCLGIFHSRIRKMNVTASFPTICHIVCRKKQSVSVSGEGGRATGLCREVG